MILEIAQLSIKSGMEAEFEACVVRAEAIFSQCRGCRSVQVRGSFETAGRYWLFIEWDTLENHTVDFRGSEAFGQWRGLVSHCFEAPPVVEHGREAIRVL